MTTPDDNQERRDPAAVDETPTEAADFLQAPDPSDTTDPALSETATEDEDTEDEDESDEPADLSVDAVAADTPPTSLDAAANPAATDPSDPTGLAGTADLGVTMDATASADPTDPTDPTDPAATADATDLDDEEPASQLPLRPSIEAILLVTDEPIPTVTLAQILGRPQPEVAEELAALTREYTDQGRGFDLREIAGGWRLYTREEYAEVVERFVLDGQQARLTQAALETLAVVAYKQPVSRTRVSAIRGVNCDGVMRTLLSRGLVQEAGTDDESGAHLYRTTSYFLERLGIDSLEDLPDLAPYLPEIEEMEAEHAMRIEEPEPQKEPEPIALGADQL